MCLYRDHGESVSQRPYFYKVQFAPCWSTRKLPRTVLIGVLLHAFFKTPRCGILIAFTEMPMPVTYNNHHLAYVSNADAVRVGTWWHL